MFGNRLLYIVFLAVFLLIMFIGLVSGVSVSASLFRAFFAAVFFTALSWGLSLLVKRYVISELFVPVVNIEEETVGTKFDFTISETLDPNIASGSIPVEHANNKSISVENNIEYDQDFGPLDARQIDPQVEKIINSDPKRMAEIIKKMGFEN